MSRGYAIMNGDAKQVSLPGSVQPLTYMAASWFQDTYNETESGAERSEGETDRKGRNHRMPAHDVVRMRTEGCEGKDRGGIEGRRGQEKPRRSGL